MFSTDEAEKFGNAQERQQRFTSQPLNNRYLDMKAQRESLRQMYIRQKKMADPDEKYELGKAPPFYAECTDFCPEFERHEREFQSGGLDKFEKIPGTENQIDHVRAVKRYRRSAAGDPPPLPCDVRPPKILQKTLDYLLEDILGVHGLVESYSFVRDRGRAIRNDLTLQNYRGMEAVDLHERIARYHILCSHELCETEGVSLQQEHEQMRKTLQSLIEFYDEMAEDHIKCPNEPEFQAYYILTHAYSNETISRAEKLPAWVFYHPIVQKALRFASMMARTNEEYIQGRASENGSLNMYAGVFRQLAKPDVSYLFACCIHLNFVDIRRGAFKAMQKAYYCFPDDGRTTWPFADLIETLGFDDEDELETALLYYDIPTQTDDRGNKVALIGKLSTVGPDNKSSMSRGNFKEGQRKSLDPKKSNRIVSAKRVGISDTDIIQGRVQQASNGIQSFLPTSRVPLPSFTPVTPTQLPTFFSSPPRASPFTRAAGLGQNVPPTSTPFSFGAMPNQTPTPTPVLTRAKVLAAASPAPAPFFTATPIPAQPIQVVPAAPKPQIPDSVIQDFTSELVSSFVFDLLSKESFFGVLLQSRDKIVKELAWSTAAEIVDELTKELAVSRYNAAKQVSLFRTIVQEIVDQLVQDVARTESRFITAEMLTLLTEQAERISRFERFGWDRWRFQCHKKRIRLQKRQNNAINIYLNLKGSSLGPSLSSKLSPSKGNKKGMTQDFTPHLKVLEKLATNRKSWMKPLDLASILATGSKGRHQTWKLCISLASLTKSSNPLDKVLCQWTQSKVSLKNPFSSVKVKGCKSEMIGHFKQSKSSETYHAMVQKLTVDSRQSVIQPNCYSICSGLNAVLFAMETFSEAGSDAQKEYWERQWTRLYAFLSYLPVQAHVPLLIVHWSSYAISPALPSSLIEEELNLSIILKDGPISKFKILELNADPDDFSSHKSSKLFSDQLLWLIRNYPPEPLLSRNVLEEVAEAQLVPFFDDLVLRIQEAFSVPSFADLPLDFHCMIFNECVGIFNDLIECVKSTLTDSDLQSFAYPAKEFADLNVSNDLGLQWNSDEEFDRIRELVTACYLPFISELSLEGSSDVQDLHNKYTGCLDLPQLSKREIKELFKKISVLTCTPNLAPTYISNILNLYTKGALESLSRQIQALSFPYNSLVLVRQTKLWTDSSSDKMQMVVELVSAKMEAIRVIQLSPGMRKRRKGMRSSPSASKTADARKRMRGVISSAQEQLEKNRQLFNHV